ncbi:MAG: DUF4437 domain-containing protein [Planctomycetota bacterium]
MQPSQGSSTGWSTTVNRVILALRFSLVPLLACAAACSTPAMTRGGSDQSQPCPICGLHHEHGTRAETDILRAEDVEWTPLNPARGDKSPQAANLWGDRTESGATGFLVKFVDGFSSPPHIHNVTYRGVVLGGEVHNDDPTAAMMWMPPGSFWTQPAGEVHITAARGSTNIAYIEIDSGPYLVHPPEQAFDQGERPVNVHDSNMVWIRDANLVWVKQDLGVEIAYLWGSPDNGRPYGLMVRVPPGFGGTIRHERGPFRAIIVDGTLQHSDEQAHEATHLGTGSYLGTASESSGSTSLTSSSGAILYVRAASALELSAD